MKKLNSFFISKIFNNKVYNIQGAIIGRLSDFVVDASKSKPVITAIEIKSEKNISYISAKNLEVYKTNNKYVVKVNTDNLKVLDSNKEDNFLIRDFLDKQIVDIDDKKVVRVNDVRMGCISGQWYIVAVDVGFRGLLRRLGFEKMIAKLMELIHSEFRNRLIFWDSVHSLNTNSKSIKLSMVGSKIQTMHAADIADIIEDLDKNAQSAIFETMDDKRAAKVLEEVEPDHQISIIEQMSVERASDILENMPSDEAADILEDMNSDRANELIEQMEEDRREKIRELMKYEDATIGSIMAKEYISFLPDSLVEDALNALKSSEHNSDGTVGFYVTNNKGKLIGVFMPIDLIRADSKDKLYDIIQSGSIKLNDNDKLEDALELMQKYNLVSVPVTDEKGILIGVTTINDLVFELFKNGKTAA